jgi:hypothetical protein
MTVKPYWRFPYRPSGGGIKWRFPFLDDSGRFRWRFPANIGAGGGGAPYVAQAVQVSTGTKLVNSSLVSDAPSGLLSYVYWFKMSIEDFANSGVIWVQDPENFYPSNSYFSAAGEAGLIHNQMCSAQDENCIGGTIGRTTVVDPTSTLIPLDTWVPLLLAIDTTSGSTATMRFVVFLGDTQVIFEEPFDPSQSFYTDLAPFFATWNGLSFHVFDDGNAPMVSGAFADFWFAPGQFIDFSIEANRRKFIDASGKPVYLGTNGEAPTGTAPAVLLSGGASSFATNKGTGGAFTLTGSLADASTSPSD